VGEYDVKNRGSIPGGGRDFLFTTESGSALGPTQSLIQWVPEVKRQGREADHSLPSSAKVRKVWDHNSTPQYVSMEWCLIKQQTSSWHGT